MNIDLYQACDGSQDKGKKGIGEDHHDSYKGKK